MTDHPRYRIENGEHCVDIRVANVEQLFDNRDPAPFRERDLDPDLIEYLMAASEDLAGHGRFRIIVWLPVAREHDDVSPAVRAHFGYELERLDRRRRTQRRTGQVAALLGITAMVGLLTLAKVAANVPILHEGLVILSWIILWRPIETLLYEWLPAHRQRKLLRQLHDAPIELRVGKGP